MISTNFYRKKLEERKLVWMDDVVKELSSLITLYESWSIPDTRLRDEYNNLAEQVEEFFISECFDNFCNKKYSDIRYAFEDELVEQWYSRQLVPNIDDWRDQFKWDYFCEEMFWTTVSSNQERYKILVKKFLLDKR